MKGIFVVIYILIILILIPHDALAVKSWRISEEAGGWQIWIEAGNFDRRDPDKNIKKTAEADAKDRGDGYLAENKNGISVNILQATFGQTSDFAITKEKAFVEYTFNVDKAGPAFGYMRTMDLRGGGQSLWLALNPGKGGGPVQIDTTGVWTWLGKPFTNQLLSGANSIMIAKREGDERGACLVDIVMVSTVNFTPTDDHFLKARRQGIMSVDFKGKLTKVWGDIKIQ